MHLALWYVVLVCHQYDVCENYVGSVYVGGYGGLSESRLCVFCSICSPCFVWEVVMVPYIVSAVTVMHVCVCCEGDGIAGVGSGEGVVAVFCLMQVTCLR